MLIINPVPVLHRLSLEALVSDLRRGDIIWEPTRGYLAEIGDYENDVEDPTKPVRKIFLCSGDDLLLGDDEHLVRCLNEEIAGIYVDEVYVIRIMQ